MKKILFVMLLVLFLSALSFAGGRQEQPALEEGELNVAAIFTTGLEEPWDRSWYESFRRVAAEKPYGLEMTLDYTEGVWGDEAERVLREYAEMGKYDIIFATSTYSDQVRNLMDIYPEILWVVHGSGNEGHGKNQYWVYKRVHEPAYLLGMLAGEMTETNVIGAVGSYAFDDVNDAINAFFQGARDVNPEIRTRVSFIESWYDPVMAQEATNAQIAAGMDFSFQIAGAYETLVENDILGFGFHYDVNAFAPNHILSSAVAHWDPSIKWIIDEWYAYAAEGKPFNGNTEPRWFSMAEGGSDIAPFHGLADKVPDDVKALVEKTRQAIINGDLEIPLNIEVPRSN